jgi:hypothetical protein
VASGNRLSDRLMFESGQSRRFGDVMRHVRSTSNNYRDDAVPRTAERCPSNSPTTVEIFHPSPCCVQSVAADEPAKAD